MPARQVVKKNGEKKPVVCFALPKKCFTSSQISDSGFRILIRFLNASRDTKLDVATAASGYE